MTAPLRVAFDATIFGHQRTGGVSRYITEVHRALNERSDVRSYLVAGLHANEYVDRSLGSTFAIRANVFPGRFRARFGAVNASVADRLIPRLDPDLVHRTTYRMPETSQLPNVITVLDFIHDLYPDLYPDGRDARLQSAAIRKADGIICISESTRRDLEHFHPGLQVPIVVGHLAATGSRPNADELEHSVSARADRSRPRMLYVGSRFGYKGFDLLLEALRELTIADWELVCVGSPFSRSELDRMVELRLPPDRFVTTAATDAELIQHYRSASVLVYPSSYEGFGLPVLEALAQGCPVICDSNSSLTEAGGTAVQYLPDRSPAALARTLESTFAWTPATHRTIADAGIRHSDGFSWGQTAEAHLSLYRSVVD